MKYLLGVLAVVLCVGFVATGHVPQTHAATSFSIESIGTDIGLGNADLKTTVLNVIQWVLGILALVAVTMIIASVIIAATSGDSERAEKAKQTIVGAIIGLVIVLLAWAVVVFVLRTTTNVTTNS